MKVKYEWEFWAVLAISMLLLSVLAAGCKKDTRYAPAQEQRPNGLDLTEISNVTTWGVPYSIPAQLPTDELPKFLNALLNTKPQEITNLPWPPNTVGVPPGVSVTLLFAGPYPLTGIGFVNGHYTPDPPGNFPAFIVVPWHSWTANNPREPWPSLDHELGHAWADHYGGVWAQWYTSCTHNGRCPP